MDLLSIPVLNTESDTAGPIRRNAIQGAGPELSLYGCYTLYEGFRLGVSKWPQNPCLGYRTKDANGKASPYAWLSYEHVATRIDNFGAGLMHESMIDPNPDGMRLLAIYMKNRPEWIICEQACYAFGGVTVPLYDTLGPDTLAYITNQTSLMTIVCDSVDLHKVFKAKANCPSLATVVLVGDFPIESQANADKLGLRLYSMLEVERIGAAAHVPHTPPKPQDIATFCYTSGTTGEPKGALITHQNMISNYAGVMRVLESFDGKGITENDVYISYLPLPHIFERNTQVGLYCKGVAVGFYQGDPLKLMEDYAALKPTLSLTVPRLLNRLYDVITQGVASAGGMKKRLFEKALASKTAGLRKGIVTHRLWDKLVFSKIRKSLGWERLRLIGTGSAPIAPPVLDLMRCILMGGVLLEGYGQTETCSGATLTLPNDLVAGHVGPPIPCCEIQLLDVPDMGYLHTDTWHGGDPLRGGGGGFPCLGRGEILVRGPNIFKGYYKMPAETENTIDADGWLHSGDIGLWTPRGQLMIIDRKKNIFKLSQGEYVAPEKIENILSGSPLSMQSFVYGDTLKSHLVAIIVPEPEAAKKWAEEQNLQVALPDLCQDKAFCQYVLKEIKRVAKEASLAGFEVVKAVYLESNPFSIEEGMLTPTLKLKRQQVQSKYAPQLENLYKHTDISDCNQDGRAISKL